MTEKVCTALNNLHCMYTKTNKSSAVRGIAGTESPLNKEGYNGYNVASAASKHGAGELHTQRAP